jgi:hypothetical protein
LYIFHKLDSINSNNKSWIFTWFTCIFNPWSRKMFSWRSTNIFYTNIKLYTTYNGFIITFR